MLFSMHYLYLLRMFSMLKMLNYFYLPVIILFCPKYLEVSRLPFLYLPVSKIHFQAINLISCSFHYTFQFSSGGIIRLPKFEMTMVRTEANQKPVLAVEDVHIATMYGLLFTLTLLACYLLTTKFSLFFLCVSLLYTFSFCSYGRIYCLQHDRAGMILNLYRFYRDAVVHQVYKTLNLCTDRKFIV